jgi:hypothetical protein
VRLFIPVENAIVGHLRLKRRGGKHEDNGECLEFHE